MRSAWDNTESTLRNAPFEVKVQEAPANTGAA